MSTVRIVLVLVTYLLANNADEPGACCLSNGECIIVEVATCDQIAGSYWAGEGTDCLDRDGGGSPDACFPTKQKMVWLEGSNSVFRSNHDASNIEKLPLHDVYILRVDADRGKLYWIDNVGRRIRRSDFDGTNIQDVIVGLRSNATYTMFLDLARRTIYFSNNIGSFVFPMDDADAQPVCLWTEADWSWTCPHPDGNGVRLDIGSGRITSWTITRPSACDGMKMDANGDGRIDLRDYAAFQRCLSNGKEKP